MSTKTSVLNLKTPTQLVSVRIPDIIKFLNEYDKLTLEVLSLSCMDKNQRKIVLSLINETQVHRHVLLLLADALDDERYKRDPDGEMITISNITNEQVLEQLIKYRDCKDQSTVSTRDGLSNTDKCINSLNLLKFGSSGKVPEDFRALKIKMDEICISHGVEISQKMLVQIFLERIWPPGLKKSCVLELATLEPTEYKKATENINNLKRFLTNFFENTFQLSINKGAKGLIQTLNNEELTKVERAKLDEVDKGLAKILVKYSSEKFNNSSEKFNNKRNKPNDSTSSEDIDPRGNKYSKDNKGDRQGSSQSKTSGKTGNWDEKQNKAHPICLVCGNDNNTCSPVKIHHSGNCPRGCLFCKEKGCNPYKCKKRFAGWGCKRSERATPAYRPNSARRWQMELFYENPPSHKFDENGYPKKEDFCKRSERADPADPIRPTVSNGYKHPSEASKPKSKYPVKQLLSTGESNIRKATVTDAEGGYHQLQVFFDDGSGVAVATGNTPTLLRKIGYETIILGVEDRYHVETADGETHLITEVIEIRKITINMDNGSRKEITNLVVAIIRGGADQIIISSDIIKKFGVDVMGLLEKKGTQSIDASGNQQVLINQSIHLKKLIGVNNVVSSDDDEEFLFFTPGTTPLNDPSDVEIRSVTNQIMCTKISDPFSESIVEDDDDITNFE